MAERRWKNAGESKELEVGGGGSTLYYLVYHTEESSAVVFHAEA